MNKYVFPPKRPINPQIICECGGTYKMYNRAQHFKTQMHKNYVKQKNKNKS